MTSKRIPLAIALLLLVVLGSCRPANNLPTRSSPQYNELVRTFYIGLAALQVGHDVQADAKLQQFTQLAPMEPAGWANWGLLALRQRNYDVAADRLRKARDLAPDNSDIFYLIGLLESSRGNTAESINVLTKSVELDQNNLIAINKLAEEVERQGGEQSSVRFESLVEKILAAQPENLAALVELSRASAKNNNANTLKSTLARITAQSSSWPPEVKQQLTALQDAANVGDMNAAATRATFLKNVLLQLPQYRQSLAAIKPPPGEEAVPFTRFVRLESPLFQTAAADTSIAFKGEPVPGTDKAEWVGAISLSGEGAPVIATGTGSEVRLSSGAILPYPGGTYHYPPGHEGVLPIDFSYDFKTDLVFASDGGVRFFKQNSPSSFTDVTNDTKLRAATINQRMLGAATADIEADGDLDVVLEIHEKVPTVLRNNGDGTFIEMYPFPGVQGLQDFAWADLDGDGDPDAALIDSDRVLHVFSNERQGQFTKRNIPANLAPANAINVMDADNDGLLDLVILHTDGTITRLSDKDHGLDWVRAEIAKTTDVGSPSNQSQYPITGPVRLKIADLDNNGGLDLAVLSAVNFNISIRCPPPCTAGALIWLNDGNGKFVPIKDPVWTDQVFDVSDVNGDGRLDLLGVSLEGHPRQAINSGTKNYHWQIVRPRATSAVGDQRINPFGVGGEMEIRAGLLVQKQPITGPLLHFGLGEQTSTDVIRVTWPNGTVRADFEVKADQEIAIEQRLKGSCPFLFAYNGKQMEFVKDAVPWSSAIGLRINTLGTASVEATEEWYKIGRDQLVPHDGYYDLRITAELWETYYYDHLALMVVDHPVGTEIFVDERFVIPPAKLEVTTVSTPHQIARATDDKGQDVTGVVNKMDGNYLDTFERGKYQGVARDHYVEIDLGDEAPASGPLWLIANGWMHPTDSSINVAISQGQQEPAKPLSLEVPDGRGGWQVVRKNMGFPAGRKKICLIDLTGVFKPGIPRRLRLRTNLEIFWDSLEWAVGLPGAQLKTTRLNPDVADLHHRGYSVINQTNDSSPEVPDYNRLASSKQIWRDLIGYYTRFGDVGELLLRPDDRYVIMNAGDEMSFRFAEQPPPPAGWVRDYIIVGDGWIKDGDYNSTFSKTVLPLPFHAKNQYITPPGRLEDEVVYRQHPEDWQNYHTRYVTADVFQNALRPQRKK
jgi:tetratricopeptide (TPR) repeat protein